MTSHEYANKLRQFAEFLLSKPEIDTHTDKINDSFWYWTAKDQFLAAVRAMKPGRKEYGEGIDRDSLNFYPSGAPEGVNFYLRINRAALCRKVQEEKWECDPLLSADEEAELGGAE